ncbi:hypothetical protein [Blastopirellula marina]|uniref:hypothetical protein n=1 Tax=Blastopirellula marina TaxID=124 RepID=UPI0011B03CF5|nr:hypothetical protein [Blastopirellula marina]
MVSAASAWHECHGAELETRKHLGRVSGNRPFEKDLAIGTAAMKTLAKASGAPERKFDSAVLPKIAVGYKSKPFSQ